MGTPRRSSYILNQVVPPRFQLILYPPFIPDMETLSPVIIPNRPARRDRSPPGRHPPREPEAPSHKRSPGPYAKPIEVASYRSYHSNFSSRRRRYSFTSGTERQQTVRGFDATTYSGGSVIDPADVPVPQPLGCLGGDRAEIFAPLQMLASSIRQCCVDRAQLDL